MTPAEIVTAARRKYNAATSSFYSDAELYGLIYQAELEIASETVMLEGRAVISGGSVAGTQSYAFPDEVLTLKRVEYDGQAMDVIDMTEDDYLTFSRSNSTTQGTPQACYVWDRTIYFRPIPDASSVQIRLYFYVEPVPVTSPTQVLEVPKVHHFRIVDFLAAWLALKDENVGVYDRYMQLWNEKHMPQMKAWARRNRAAAGFKMVKDEGLRPGKIVGVV